MVVDCIERAAATGAVEVDIAWEGSVERDSERVSTGRIDWGNPEQEVERADYLEAGTSDLSAHASDLDEREKRSAGVPISGVLFQAQVAVEEDPLMELGLLASQAKSIRVLAGFDLSE